SPSWTSKRKLNSCLPAAKSARWSGESPANDSPMEGGGPPGTTARVRWASAGEETATHRRTAAVAHFMANNMRPFVATWQSPPPLFDLAPFLFRGSAGAPLAENGPRRLAWSGWRALVEVDRPGGFLRLLRRRDGLDDDAPQVATGEPL